MQVHLLVETWGYDAPRVIKAYVNPADAREALLELINPYNYEVWGPVDVVQ